jgi:hypothetical protein
MFSATAELDDTDVFLQNLAAKASQKSTKTQNELAIGQKSTKLDQSAADTFQFPMDEWLAVEQEILFQPPPPTTATDSLVCIYTSISPFFHAKMGIFAYYGLDANFGQIANRATR